MPRKYARSNRKVSRTKGTHKRTNRFRRSGFRVLSRRISAVSKRVAGEVCKFESTPELFKHALLSFETSSSYTVSFEQPLLNITSGNPWVMPLNWVYQQPYSSSGSISTPPFYNGSVQGFPVSGSPVYTSLKQPIWYNALFENENNAATPNSSVASSTDYQYRLKYMYINALFNASVQSSQNNTDGALRIVIVKDKQPTGGAATWFDSNITANSRGVFNAQRIDAQLNPQTVGRFKILYDKTLRFNNINGYKTFKWYRKNSTTCRNNRVRVNTVSNAGITSGNYAQTNDESPPVQKNAFYILIFSDGLNFTYTNDASTPAASFHLFNRVAYYNN